MNLNKLKQKIYDANIPGDWYSIDEGLKSDAFILFKNYDKWEFFFLDERGGRNDFRVFYDDETAFDYMWRKIERRLKYSKIKPRDEG